MSSSSLPHRSQEAPQQSSPGIRISPKRAKQELIICFDFPRIFDRILDRMLHGFYWSVAAVLVRVFNVTFAKILILFHYDFTRTVARILGKILVVILLGS